MAPATATLAPSAASELSAQSATPALANVLYEKKDAIAYVTVNRPKVLNALNTPTWKDLRIAFEDARDDATVLGVILTGAGDKAFIAGADIGELAHATAIDAEQSSRFGQNVLDLIENLGKPVIAAINGFALGGGCETAMACTIRIAADSAKFGQPEVKLGSTSGRRRHAAPASLGRQRPRPATHPLRRNDQRAGGLPHRARERSRASGKPHRARRTDPQADRFQCSGFSAAITRSRHQGNGHQSERRLRARSLLFRPLRRDGRQKGGHLGLPGKARTPVSRALR